MRRNSLYIYMWPFLRLNTLQLWRQCIPCNELIQNGRDCHQRSEKFLLRNDYPVWNSISHSSLQVPQSETGEFWPVKSETELKNTTTTQTFHAIFHIPLFLHPRAKRQSTQEDLGSHILKKTSGRVPEWQYGWRCFLIPLPVGLRWMRSNLPLC